MATQPTDTSELDAILEARLLHWLNASERQREYNQQHNVVSKYETSPHQAMDKVEQSAQPKSTVQGDLELTNQELATVQRALQFQDSMSDERLEETLKKEARLIKRCAELKKVQAHGEQLARQREQAKDDIHSFGWLRRLSRWKNWLVVGCA